MTEVFLVGTASWNEEAGDCSLILPKHVFFNREDAERYTEEYNKPIKEARKLLVEWHDAVRAELVRMGRDEVKMGYASWMYRLNDPSTMDAVVEAESRVWQDRERPTREISEELSVISVPVHD